MVVTQGVGLGAASQSRPKRGRDAADLARASLLTFEPQVGFPVQLKLQMMRKRRNARFVPGTPPSAVTDPLREPAGLDCDGEPLSGLIAELASLCNEHLGFLRHFGALSLCAGRSSAQIGIDVGFILHRGRQDGVC